MTGSVRIFRDRQTDTLTIIRRRRQELRERTKGTFGVFLHATGRKYFCQITGKSDKKHLFSDSTSDTSGEGRLYATRDI